MGSNRQGENTHLAERKYISGASITRIVKAKVDVFPRRIKSRQRRVGKVTGRIKSAIIRRAEM
jgi:hypothetical protein